MPGNDERLTCGFCDRCSYLLPAQYCQLGEQPGCVLLFNNTRGERARIGYMSAVAAAAEHQTKKEGRA